jgi:phosphoglycerate dehydrogenase-like enzyme
VKVWIAHEEGRDLLGELPPGTDLEVYDGIGPMPSDPGDVAFWVPAFNAVVKSVDLLGKFGALEVVQLLSAGADAWAGRMPPGVLLCDARGVHDAPVAEWVLGAAIGVFRQFPALVRAQERQEWVFGATQPTRELTGKRVLIVGAGSIGAAIEERMRPFGVTITRVARTARPAEDVHAVEELPGLLGAAEVVVLVVPLTGQTRGLVDAAFLAALPDGALLINVARGPVVDTAALVAEVASGRISAALDVTDPEPLPAGHPLWSLPNVFIAPHTGGAVQGLLPRAYALTGAQLRRFAAGDELINQVREGY